MERVREYSWCCGSGGGVWESDPDFAEWTARDRIEEAIDTGAEALVTACPWCERVFKDASDTMEKGIKVLDIMELMNISLGGEENA